MKKITVFLIMLFLLQNGFAQNKIELFDFIKMLIPDSANSNKEMVWSTSTEFNKNMKWKSALPKNEFIFGPGGKKVEQWKKEGTARILLNGKDFTCENRVESIKHPCSWDFSFQGSRTGYSTIYISNTDFPIDDHDQAIEMLFEKNFSSFQRIKKCMEGAVMWEDLYTVRIPGKKPAWLLIQYESLSATGGQYKNTKTDNTFSLIFYLNKADIGPECAGIPELPETIEKKSSVSANEVMRAARDESTAKQSETKSSENRRQSAGLNVTSAPKPVDLNSVAASLFNSAKTKLSVAQKNEVAYLTGIKLDEINAKTRNGKPKYGFDIYPMDFNKNGTEEIFLCITTKPLGIPMHTYYFYALNNLGHYQPSPGVIGQGVKILLNRVADFPDLICGSTLGDHQVWRWNGQAYRLAQTISSGIAIKYPTKSIEEASQEYVESHQ